MGWSKRVSSLSMSAYGHITSVRYGPRIRRYWRHSGHSAKPCRDANDPQETLDDGFANVMECQDYRAVRPLFQSAMTPAALIGAALVASADDQTNVSSWHISDVLIAAANVRVRGKPEDNCSD